MVKIIAAIIRHKVIFIILVLLVMGASVGGNIFLNSPHTSSPQKSRSLSMIILTELLSKKKWYQN